MRGKGTGVLVAGDGIVGMATALACAARGCSVTVIGRRLPGAATSAAAGLLAPSLGDVSPPVRAIMLAARDGWPGYGARLADASGVDIEVNALGILELAADERERERLFTTGPAWAERLPASELAKAEPALAGSLGALLHAGDGAVDNVAVLRALDGACASHQAIERVDTLARSVEPRGEGVALTVSDGRRFEGDVVVIAAGAWARSLGGLPRDLPVTPWRGQMLALDAAVTTRCVAGGGSYLVPRGGRTLVGSTMERVGFDVATTDDAIDSLRRAATRLAAPLRAAREAERWAGLRPMTPDLLPIVGPDPVDGRIVYGCGLSKNGILLAPLVADAIADWCAGTSPPHDLRPFAVDRFGMQNS